MALAYLTINLDAFTGDDRPPISQYSITLDPGADHIDEDADVIHVRTIVVSLDQQGKAATANGVPCVDGKVPVVAGVMYAVLAPNVLRDGPHYIPALTAGQVVALSDYITPGAPLTPDQAAILTARIKALEAAPPGVTDHGALTGLGDDDHLIYLTTGRGDARYVQGSDSRLSDARTPTAHTHPVAQVSDSTATGRALVTAADAAAARGTLGLDTAATVGDLPIPDPGSFYPTDTITAALQLIGGRERYGTGSPEGVVTAPVGTYYTDTAITNGALRWAKKSGAGNTGWKAVEGDTGWRDIRSLYGTTVAQLVDNAVCGRIKRVNSTVTYQALVYPAGATIGATRSALIPNLITAIPAGFAADGNQPLGQASYSGNVGMVSNLITGSRFDVQMPTLTGTWGAADLISASATWVTSAAWPTTLPGVAA